MDVPIRLNSIGKESAMRIPRLKNGQAMNKISSIHSAKPLCYADMWKKK